jgi:hypothetical protein
MLNEGVLAMKTTFVLTVDPDVAEYLALKTEGVDLDINTYINEILLREKKVQERQGKWPPKVSPQPQLETAGSVNA